MSRKAHRDNEMRPPASALAALAAWLDDHGLRRVALVEALAIRQAQVSRVFAGEGYLSATQRREIEKFTEGAITAAMLEGRAQPPSKIEPGRRLPVEAKAQVAASPRAGPATPPDKVVEPPRHDGPDDAERIVDNLAAKAMPAAFKVILEQMVKGKSESERRRCAEILIEHLRGKAKQYEKREQLVQPVSNEVLLRKLHEIESNLKGARRDEQP
ncbi:MAG: hypothetical protein QM765_07755 [Myxococcales bacterium]